MNGTQNLCPMAGFGFGVVVSVKSGFRAFSFILLMKCFINWLVIVSLC